MKIILVSPPYGLEELVGETASMKGVMNIIPPLGLAYIAAVVEQNNYDVEIIDCSLSMTHAELEAALTRSLTHSPITPQPPCKPPLAHAPGSI